MRALEFSVMGVYALLMAILTVYSVHAYLMVFLSRRRRAAAAPPPPPVAWPTVTVQLPIYNERYVVERLLRAVCALDYPRDALEIQVLDDSTDETRALVAGLTARYRAEGFAIRHRHRERREGYKAGALREGLAEARGEFLAIFDADFVPPPDFLKRLLPYFDAPEVGLVQARWGHLNAGTSPLTRGQAIGLDAHFVLEQGVRNARGLFINFNGTAGIWRQTAILAAGNWQDDTLTEDIDLSYRAQMAGWRFVYVNSVVCPAEVPAEIHGLKTQQYRWAKGAIQTARKLLPAVWRSRRLSGLAKFEATVHLTNHLVFPALLLAALLMLPLLWLRARRPEYAPFFRFASIFTLNAFSYPLFYLAAQRALYADWKRRLLYLPVLMAGATGLSVVNTRAVFSALAGRRSAFTRTPKYALGGARRETWRGKRYRTRVRGTVWIEAALAAYLTLALGYAWMHTQYVVIPFLAIYWSGFCFIAGLSALHAARS